jgi:DNA-binding Xre family transcriptional regulator
MWYNAPYQCQSADGSGREEQVNMAVSYKKLFKILIDRDMKKKEFRELVGISYSTMSKLEKGENTNVDVLERICLKMNCRIEDIMEVLPDLESTQSVPDEQNT